MDQHDDRPVPLQEADGTSRTANLPHGPAARQCARLHRCRADFARGPAGFRRFARAGGVVPSRRSAACRRGLRRDAAPGSGPRGRDALGALASPTLAIGAGLVIGAIVLGAWRTPALPPSDMLMAVGGGMVLLAFPILVLERSWAAVPATTLAEAAGLAALLRAVLLVQLGLGLALMLQGSAFPIAAVLVPALAALVLLLAAEFVLRGVAALFLPTPASSVARPAASSAVAACIRLRLPHLAAVNQAVTQQWGIDLSRSWALGFAGRALLPIGLLLALLAWGLTGLVALPLDQRAVYEQFGRPIAVLGPGLRLFCLGRSVFPGAWNGGFSTN